MATIVASMEVEVKMVGMCSVVRHSADQPSSTTHASSDDSSAASAPSSPSGSAAAVGLGLGLRLGLRLGVERRLRLLMLSARRGAATAARQT
eukprot:COSAG04_NODE_6560_length_1304_cov_31.166805_2_plen_92_part_01